MTDFDFDELDRAVSGALGSDPVDSSAPSPEAEPVSVNKTPSNPVIRRSSGRFMDVVHPSSDMRSRPATVGDALATSHVAPTVEPNPIVNRASEPQLPLEETSSDTATAWQTPLESPFLPDAKVEKRPLGGGEPAGPSIGNEVIDKEKTDSLLGDELKLEASDEPLLEASTMPDPIDFANAQNGDETTKEEPSEEPASKTVPEVEAVAFEVVPETAEEVTEKEPKTPVELTKEEELSYHEAEPATSASTFAAPVEEPTGPTSITPQYKEQPSSSQPSGAIYDTESYHQPLGHPAKKRSGVLVIIWVILLVGLGAAAGAAFYLYVLPHL